MNARLGIDKSVLLEAQTAALRSRTYGLFARAFRYPESETVQLFINGTWAREMMAALEQLTPSLAKDGESFARPISSEPTELEMAYLTTFHNDLPVPSVSLYEGSYGEHQNDRPSLLLELKAFYRHFGLSMATNDIEDSLPAELEFMQFLAAKQAVAMNSGGTFIPYLHAQRDFIQRHLATWLPAFAKELAMKFETGFFSRLAAMQTEFVAMDAAFVSNAFDRLASPNS